jgi:predicted small metal-binding protein
VDERRNAAASSLSEPRCDCGYTCTGATLEDQIQDALRHAQDAHGIDVSPAQVLASDAGASLPARGNAT